MTGDSARSILSCARSGRDATRPVYRFWMLLTSSVFVFSYILTIGTFGPTYTYTIAIVLR